MEYKDYILHKRLNKKVICGEVNLPALTECYELAGFIFYKDKKICFATSETAHQYFARNDDGNGLERGQLTAEIVKILTKQNSKYQERWDRVWADSVCQKYKRPEHDDFWLWNHDFYEANIDDLKYILKLIK